MGLYKKQKMREGNETAALAEVLAYKSHIMAEIDEIKALLKKERAEQEAELAKLETDVDTYISKEKDRMKAIESYNDNAIKGFERRIEQRKATLEFKQKELDARKKKVEDGNKLIASEKTNVANDRRKQLDVDMAAMAKRVEDALKEKNQAFTVDLEKLEADNAAKRARLEALEKTIKEQDAVLKAREEKSNLVLTPNVVIDKSGAPELKMEKWTVA